MEFNPGTPYELLSKIQETAAAEDYTPSTSIKKTIRTRNLTLPNLVESGDETDSDSDPFIHKAAHVATGRAQLNVLHPSGTSLYGDLRQRSITKEMNTISCIDMMNANKPNINEKIEFKPGRKPKEAIEGDMIRFMYNDYDNGSVSWLQGR